MELERLKGSGRVVEYGEFLRFSEKAGGMPRGTLIAGDRTIHGYPKIPRIFVLGEGIERNLQSGEMLVEEKIDGYNVRALMYKGNLTCLSRGGYIDGFAAEKLSDGAGVKKFFSAHPGWMLCGEMLGNTPHTDPTDEYDVKYYVFDIIDERGEFLPPMERRDLCKEFGLTPVPLVGVFRREEIAKLKGAVRKMDKEGKEGIVVRGLEGGEIFKFVTPSSDIHDLAESSAHIFDMPSGFMKQRVFRSAVSLRELGMKKADYAKKLGDALYSGLEGALEAKEAVQRFRVRVKNRSTWDSILSGMGHGVELKVEKEERKGKGYEITFVKVMKESTRMARRAVEGRTQED
ncbi:MAG: RNA ligase [Candidatus ainarchaeum sp.]|nr:RNA ligase [Candidatus ainarchaeum sp.]MDD5096841.1 RNA ligase [Candidatus ainarchaeum sp.]